MTSTPWPRRFLILPTTAVVALLTISGFAALLWFGTDLHKLHYLNETLYGLIALPLAIVVAMVFMGRKLVVDEATREIRVDGSREPAVRMDSITAILVTDGYAGVDAGQDPDRPTTERIAGVPAGVYLVTSGPDQPDAPALATIERLITLIKNQAAVGVADWSPEAAVARLAPSIRDWLSAGAWRFCYRGFRTRAVVRHLRELLKVPAIFATFPPRAEVGDASAEPEPEPAFEPEVKPGDGRVMIARFDNALDYQMARSALAAAGIDATADDLFIANTDWLMMNIVDQIKMSVAVPDAQRAREVLAGTPARARLVDGSPLAWRSDRPFAEPQGDAGIKPGDADGDAAATRPGMPEGDGFDVCPSCGSTRTEIYNSTSKRVALLLMLFLSFMLPFWIRRPARLHCLDCGRLFDPQ